MVKITSISDGTSSTLMMAETLMAKSPDDNDWRGDIHNDEVPQVTVPARAWQAAESFGDWTLVGCTVAPGFQFEGFELAPAHFTPRR